MKKITFMVFFILFSSLVMAQQKRNCHTMENLEYRKSIDPSIEQKMQDIELFTQEKQKALRGNRAKVIEGDIIKIPVVVHVIYSRDEENISDAQIQSQIDILNEDFRRTNSDITDKWSQATDTQIEFQLSSVDPNGISTNGITRQYSLKTEWGTDDIMKRASSGGVDPWNTAEYLNIWVCNIGDGTLGYAQFPGGSAATDGIVISPQFFGSSDKGSGFYLSAPFDKGRTTTHEVGHFLNLRHIWGDGDEGEGCDVDDLVSDTPESDEANYQCASGHESCGSEDMVENYMDYSDDGCMNLFTEGQKTRMRTVLEAGGVRHTLALSDKFGQGIVCELPVPTGLSSSNVNDTGFTVSWSAVSGATTYRLRINGGTPIIVSETEYIASELVSGTDYLVEVSAGCEQGGYGDEVLLTVKTTGIAPIVYCDVRGSSVVDEYISRVQLGTIDNVSGGSDEGYEDFTSISTDLVKSETAEIMVTPFWTETIYNEGYAAYIDYNQDGDFEDTDEQVWLNEPTQNTIAQGKFKIPESALEGATRLRVSLRYDAEPSSSCQVFDFGEIEDYTVNIVVSTLSIDENVIENTGISVYPNPTTRILHVNLNSTERLSTYKIVSIIGQVVKEGVLDSETINVSGLDKGIYLLTVNDGQTTTTIKFIKK